MDLFIQEMCPYSVLSPLTSLVNNNQRKRTSAKLTPPPQQEKKMHKLTKIRNFVSNSLSKWSDRWTCFTGNKTKKKEMMVILENGLVAIDGKYSPPWAIQVNTATNESKKIARIKWESSFFSKNSRIQHHPDDIFRYISSLHHHWTRISPNIIDNNSSSNTKYKINIILV